MQIGNSSVYNNTYLQNSPSLEKISSGLDINKAADNASGLAISENLKVQANGISQSIENVNSGVAYAQIGDKALAEQSSILDTIKEKLLQASTDTTGEDGRNIILQDIKKLLEQVDNIAEQTNYNGRNLLQQSSEDASASDAFQVQAGESASDVVEAQGIQSNTQGLGLSDLLNQDASSFSSSDARAFLDDVDNALTSVNENRAEFGSTSNQLQSAGRNLSSQYTNTRSAQSEISDVDYAKEISSFSKQNILAQFGAYGQVQANGVNQQMVSRLLT